jgi:hypothetical protein
MAALKQSSIAKKRLNKSLLAGALVTTGALAGIPLFPDTLHFESLESKTTEDGPVYNEVRWFSSLNQEVWMMRQSHGGPHAEAGQWDRLAIVIDKTSSPKTARFVQLEPGPLEWKEGLKEKPFRVSCFLCHSNGPRVIRPNTNSIAAPLKFIDRLRIQAWNLRMKTYGRVVPDPSHADLDSQAKIPFRMKGNLENDTLKVQTCTRCHQESGWFSRGRLHRQQAITIQFMVSNGFMPPLGLSLSNSDRLEIQAFIDGL